ncbi:hypothetical protein GYMLUDRAFT_34794 [Collybiopsis luxurians FD-317 M1]|nr:hypothetical protein GYMLUDRAFT_34794 [Collybiopsis luxurians FD-317 M1]
MLDWLAQFAVWKADCAVQPMGSAVQVSKLRECRFILTPDPFYIGEGWGGNRKPADPKRQPHMYELRVWMASKSDRVKYVKPPPPPLNRALARHDVEFMDMVKTQLGSMDVRCLFDVNWPPLTAYNRDYPITLRG